MRHLFLVGSLCALSLPSGSLAQAPFLLPFEEGTAYMCTQGPSGATSHTGPNTKFDLDFSLPFGISVQAAADGTAFIHPNACPCPADRLNLDKQGCCLDRLHCFGLYVTVVHSCESASNCLCTLYAHLTESKVRSGQSVSTGDVVGRSDCTGFSTGDHLHFGLHRCDATGNLGPSLPIDHLLARDRTDSTIGTGEFSSLDFVCDLPSGHVYESVRPSTECTPGDSRSCTTSCGSIGVQTCTSTWGPCVPPAESCSNGRDDDCDGKADCQDTECARAPSCSGGSCVGFGQVDQYQIHDSNVCGGGAGQILIGMPAGQEFTPSKSTILAVELLLLSANSPYTDNLTVRIREASITGAILGTSRTESISRPPDSSWTFWQRFVFPLPVFVLPGEKYVYEVVATNVSFGQLYVDASGPCDYPGGVLIGNGRLFPTLDRNFVTCGQ